MLHDYVIELKKNGFQVDEVSVGEPIKEGSTWDLPFPNILGEIPEGQGIEEAANNLQQLFPTATVEVSYCPTDGSRNFAVYPEGVEAKFR